MAKVVSRLPSTSFWRGKRVLVTGHTGFKGSWLSLWLEGLGAKVSGLALAPEPHSLFSEARLGERVASHTCDVRDVVAVRQLIEQTRPEIVVHMAAQSLVRPSYHDPVATYAINVMGTVHVLDACRASDVTRAMLVVTSDKCYDNREWARPYREDDPIGGHDPYSNSKGCAELVTAAYRASFFSTNSGRGLASARAGNVIGGGDWAEHRLLPDCMRALRAGRAIEIRNPSSIRPWQHVLEPLSGYLVLLEQLWSEPGALSQGWNFGPVVSDARPVRWIAERVVKKWGGSAEWRTTQSDAQPHEAAVLRLDSTAAMTKLGWAPRLRLADAVDWTVDWYRRAAGGESAAELCLEQIAAYADRPEAVA
jgi:CDP-glucose 4,6-dehydratase